jgi:hypothetical protein
MQGRFLVQGGKQLYIYIYIYIVIFTFFHVMFFNQFQHQLGIFLEYHMTSSTLLEGVIHFNMLSIFRFKFFRLLIFPLLLHIFYHNVI